MKTTLFDTGRADYYRQKQKRLQREKEDRSVVAEDAVYIKHYGMDAYMKLFPEAADMPVSWHSAVIKELQRLDRQELANTLSGYSLAASAPHSKKASKALRHMIKGLTS